MTDATEQLIQSVDALIAARQWNELRAKVAVMQPYDIADLMQKLEKRHRVLFYRALPRDVSADVFVELSHEDAEYFLHELSDDETRSLLEELEPDDRAEVLGELPGVVVQRLLNLLDEKARAKTKALLGYPEDSMGRLMTPGYVAIRPNWTAEEALAHVRKRDPQSETIYFLYVTDESWHLLGVLSLRELIFADPSTRIDKIMERPVIKALATDDRERATRIMSRYDLSVLPVVDKDNVLVGIVTIDDVLDVVEEETTEDFYKSGAVEVLGMDLGQASVGLLYSKRIWWLVALIFINLISGAIIIHFETTIEAAVVLVSFLPLLAASAGNTGSQAATLAVRSLATGEIRMKDWFSIIGKELLVATALGATLSFVVWWLGLWRAGTSVAIVVSLTMIIVVIVGSLVGVSLPFILRKLKLDPAVASSPLVATVSDVFGVLVYFAIATVVLGL